MVSLWFPTQNREWLYTGTFIIMWWTLKTSCYVSEIVYRPGQQNGGAAEVLSRICLITVNSGTRLNVIHKALCHPGITHLNPYV